MTGLHDFHELPPDLPVPQDDGAASGIEGSQIPALELESTIRSTIDLREASAGTLVLYVYPRTGVPGQPAPAGWDQIPGARGCTPENCAFRDTEREIRELGASVMGLSSQPFDEQREFAKREHIPHPLLNDSELVLARELGLPTFETVEMTLYKRITLIARRSRIVKVFYPVFPPDRHPEEVLVWLSRSPLPPAYVAGR
jgi:peroxiredoxin